MNNDVYNISTVANLKIRYELLRISGKIVNIIFEVASLLLIKQQIFIIR